MKTMKTAISMDADLFQRADQIAKREGISRSEFYSKAIRQMVEQEQNRDLLRRLDDAHAAPQSAAEKAWLQDAKKRHARIIQGDW